MDHQHPNIKFAFEVEKSYNLLFSNVKICEENNEFTTSVFRKPADSAVQNNFVSLIPISYRQG